MKSERSFETSVDRPAAEVAALYASPDYFDHRNRHVGAWNMTPIESRSDNGCVILSQTMNMKAAVPLPAFAQRVIGEAVRVTQHYTWDAQRQIGVLQVTPSILPIKLEGSMQVHPAQVPGQCLVSSRWRVECRIPLVGHKIEQLLLEDLRKRLEMERDTLHEYGRSGEPANKC